MGLRPKPRQGLCPLHPQQRARPFAIYQLGFVLRGGPTVTYQRPCWPSPENKPINGFQGPLPLAEVEDWAAKSGPMSLLVGFGAKPRSFTGSSDCPDPD